MTKLGGRPPLHENKKIVFTFRMKRAEWEEVKEAAHRAGVQVSEYVRAVLLMRARENPLELKERS